MNEPTILFAFADNPGTTGHHLLRAGQKKPGTTHGAARDPSDPWLLWVESFGKHLLLPTPEQILGGKVAAWMIDSHVNIHWQRRVAPAFAHIFCAQRSAVRELRSELVPCSWLPLAAPKELVDKGALLRDRPFDLAFVGAAPPGSARFRLLSALRNEFSFVPTSNGFIPPSEMMDVYRRAKIVVNLPIRGDLNMRTFEAAAAGSLLATSPCDGLEVIFPAGAPELVPDRDPANWVRHIRSALRAEDGQARADALYDAVRTGHTYEHRVREVQRVLLRTQPAAVLPRDRLRALVSGFVHYGQPANVLATSHIGPLFQLRSAASALAVAAARPAFSRASEVFPELVRIAQRVRSRV